jgi:circadian clock protein KaiB
MHLRSKKAAKKQLSETAQFEKLLRQSSKADRYVLRLYITGSTPRSAAAIANIRSLCDEYLHSRYDLEVVDIYQQPAAAAGNQIIAAPTLIKQFPTPVKRMVGDLGDRNRVLVGLDLADEVVGANVGTKWAKV